MQELNLEYRGIDVNSLEEIFNQSGMTSINTLNLQGNYLANPGITKLGPFLTTHPNITRLNIANNKIEQNGFNTFAQTLPSNLEYLNLSENWLTPPDDVDVIKSLLNLKHLKILHLNNLSLSESAIKVLMTGISNHASLLEVQMQSNYILDEFYPLFESTKCANTNCKIDIRYNGFNETQEQFLLLNDNAIINQIVKFLRAQNIYQSLVTHQNLFNVLISNTNSTMPCINREDSFFNRQDDTVLVNKINTLCKKMPHYNLLLNNQKLREKFITAMTQQFTKHSSTSLHIN